MPHSPERMMTIRLYDTTLRDGTQREGLSLSVEDKLKIARVLDRLGVSYIEGGWPGSNPKDADFFRRIRESRSSMRGSRPSAAPAGPGIRCEDDANLRALLAAETPRRHHRRQELDPARGSRARDHPGREPPDDRRERRLSKAAGER